jgi:hypothetical protein
MASRGVAGCGSACGGTGPSFEERGRRRRRCIVVVPREEVEWEKTKQCSCSGRLARKGESERFEDEEDKGDGGGGPNLVTRVNT